MNRIKRMLRSTQMANGVWLYFLQFFQMVVPLLTFPYITRVLGVNLYGDFSIALVIVTYLQVLVEYGFNFSGTRKLAISKEEKYSEVYSNIFWAKMILMLGSILLVICVFLVSGYSLIQRKCIMALFGIVIGTAFQQTWVFQGVQKMKYITIINVVARVLSVGLIFLFVRNSNDIYMYCFLYASTNVISGLISIFICKISFGLSIHYYGMHSVVREIKDGFSLFLTSAMAKVVASVGTFFTGIYASNYDVGVYSAVQKIPNIMVLCYSPISQVLFPYISKLFGDNASKAKKIVKILCGPIMLLVICVCGCVGFIAKPLISILCGTEYISGSVYVYVLLIWIVFSILNNILGSLIMVASGRSKQYSTIFVMNVVFSIILNYILVVNWSCFGAALATLVSEIVLSLVMICYIVKEKKKIFE